ncbi:MAG: YjfB family protein [Gammaproteobacteria bacterium]|nr:YjfB family protein [Gammaproteobacteria bacterium]MBU1600860.1 YjfB family protein [Gammaproteobacteria bacterium]MBU2435316.1 YjfB family protein [Gammaproteobacteria bacterium]MBU2448730.1 YjfB family protein [Gammaproteobacteria bacterium]
MDVSSLGSLSAAMSPVEIRDAANTMVLKKAIDIQEQNAMQLLEALPQVPSNPSNLGNSVDVKV